MICKRKIKKMKSANAKLEGSLKHVSGANIDFKVALILFKEDGIFITYCPSLDLSGYGNSEQEAQDSIKHVVREYIDYGIKKGTLLADMQKYGWQIINKKRNTFKAPDFEQLLRDNEDFSDIINNKQYQKIDMPFEIPEFA